jgi:hypothetical protein
LQVLLLFQLRVPINHAAPRRLLQLLLQLKHKHLVQLNLLLGVDKLTLPRLKQLL